MFRSRFAWNMARSCRCYGAGYVRSRTRNPQLLSVFLSACSTPSALAGGGTFMNTGADSCANSVTIPIEIGLNGSPAITTVLGDNTTATAGGCFLLAGVPTWWEKFDVPVECRLVLEFCGTTPVHDPMTATLFRACTAASCQQPVAAESFGQGSPYCADANRWAVFGPLPPGTYFYPIRADGPRGPYQLHIHADEFLIPPPDVITGGIEDVIQLGREGPVGSGIVGLGADSIACNHGRDIDLFRLPDIKHPVILANLFRLRSVDGSSRLEQIGQSWLKHTFGSSNDDLCNFGCNCAVTDCLDKVAWRCSDLYSAEQSQSCGLGPRSAVHPFTGVMPGGADLGPGGGCLSNYPANNHLGHNEHNEGDYAGVAHRLQVLEADLIPAINPGVRYFVEVQYITTDEFLSANGNQHNNASYREYGVSGPDGNGVFTFAPLAPVEQESPAIDAWLGAIQEIIEPSPLQDGRVILAHQVTDLGGGVWHYEYVLYNLNLDAAIGRLRIPISTNVAIQNIDFHAPLAHAPQPNADNYSTDPWSAVRAGGFLTFSTDSFAADPLANAVRYGTAYNFRFDANTPPAAALAEVGIFKTTDVVTVSVQAPSTPIPAASHWIMLSFGLLVTCAGTVLIHRRARADPVMVNS